MNLKKLLRSDSRFAEIVRFALVGGFATVFQYILFLVFVHAVKVPAVVSTMISYAISFVANFFLSSYFTFHKKPSANNGLGFLLSHLFNMGLQTGMVAIFKGIVGPSLALLPAICICFPVNFVLVRFAFKNEIIKSFFNRLFKRKQTGSSLLDEEGRLFESFDNEKNNKDMKKVAFASDHAGYYMKLEIKKYVEDKGYEVVDYGTHSADSCDYADYAHPAAKGVEKGECDFGIAMCGSGNGIQMTLNKHQGIRAALCWEPEIASLAKEHNNANFLVLPARFISYMDAVKIVDAYLDADFQGGRHERRIEKIPVKGCDGE